MADDSNEACDTVSNQAVNSAEFETTEQLAERTGTSKKTWERDRLDGNGPPFIRLGRRLVIYPRAGTNEWMASRTFKHRAAEAVSSAA